LFLLHPGLPEDGIKTKKHGQLKTAKGFCFMKYSKQDHRTQ
jgi:hypothetical protein